MAKGESCPACGVEVTPDRKFCPSCGEKLDPGNGHLGPPEESSDLQRDSGQGHGSRWLATVLILLVLGVVGGGVGYLIGSLGTRDSDTARSADSQAGAGNGDASLGSDGPIDQDALPQVLCAKGISPVSLEARVRPTECTFLRDGAPPDPPSVDFTSAESLDWTEWGPEKATAEGFFVAMGMNPATFELSEPRLVCGETVFTRIRVTRPGYPVTSPGPIEDCATR